MKKRPRDDGGGDIKIDAEFEKLLMPLEEEERTRLEKSIKAEGCRDPLCVWDAGDGFVLLDGHNRRAICERLGVPYQTKLLKLADRKAAFDWIVNNQLARRNVTPEQASYLRGLRYNAEKGEQGGTGANQHKQRGQNAPSAKTAERLASELKVDPATIKRDGEYALAVDALAEIGGVGTREAILGRKTKIKKADVTKLGKMVKGAKKQGVKAEPAKAKAILAKVLSGETKGVKQAINADAAAKLRAAPPPLPEGRHRVIVVDPPWQYDARADDATHRAANPYPSMTVEEIKGLPVAASAEDDCFLWLWTTNAHLRQAFEVLDAWGFTFKTVLTWAKDRMGTGDWLRGQTEHCLLAVRGSPVKTLGNQTTLLRGPLREHSRKPDEFYALVESLCPGSKIEWFAREPREGWNRHGNEPERFRTNRPVQGRADG